MNLRHTVVPRLLNSPLLALTSALLLAALPAAPVRAAPAAAKAKGSGKVVTKPDDAKAAAAKEEAAKAAAAKAEAEKAEAGKKGPSAIAGLAPTPGAPQLLTSQVPAVPAALNELVRRYGNSRSAQLFDVTTDGAQVLIGTRFGSTQQLHLVDQPLGTRSQLSFGDEPVLMARFLPQDPQVVFYLQDAGGGEFYQLYKLDRRTQGVELLTDGKSRNEQLIVSHEGRRLAWASTARNGKDTDVVLADSATPKLSRRLTEQEGSWRPLDFAPGGKQLLVVQQRSAQDADLWSVDVETGEKKRLTPAVTAETPKASIGGAVFSSDGRAVFAITDRYSDFNELVRIDPLQAAQPAKRLTASVPWDVTQVAAARDTGAPAQLAITVNQEGYDRLYVVEPGTGALQAVGLPPGQIGGLRFPITRSDLLFFTTETSRGPADVWSLDVRTRRTSRWTRSELGPIDSSQLVEPELVRYPAPGMAGVHVSAFLYKPRPPESGEARKLPVLVLWHGGPEGQSRPGFNPTVQMLVTELGLAVLLPNVRGSAGYGKAFLAADDGIKREEALKDIGATFDWIATQPDLDAARIGVQGGSYGGYMTLASVAFHPDKVKAAVDIVGISSLPSFLETTQAYRRDLRRAEYGDERIPEVRKVMERISPLGSVEKITAALYVLQGKNDPRVPQSEAEQIVQAVRGKGGQVWYGLALDEGHGFRRKENRDAQLATSLLFWQRMLLVEQGEGKQ
jgi:dipeptidyl aminopeptidase/acylaminoacyl peptidase